MESILLIFIALGEYLVHFPQGSKLWFGSCLGESHNILYKLKNDVYEILKIPPHSSPTSVHKFEWLWDHLRGHFRQLPRGNWSPNFLVKTPNLNRTLNKFAEVIRGGHKTSLKIIFKFYYHSCTFIENLEAFGSIWRSRHQN